MHSLAYQQRGFRTNTQKGTLTMSIWKITWLTFLVRHSGVTSRFQKWQLHTPSNEFFTYSRRPGTVFHSAPDIKNDAASEWSKSLPKTFGSPLLGTERRSANVGRNLAVDEVFFLQQLLRPY